MHELWPYYLIVTKQQVLESLEPMPGSNSIYSKKVDFEGIISQNLPSSIITWLFLLFVSKNHWITMQGKSYSLYYFPNGNWRICKCPLICVVYSQTSFCLEIWHFPDSSLNSRNHFHHHVFVLLSTSPLLL